VPPDKLDNSKSDFRCSMSLHQRGAFWHTAVHSSWTYPSVPFILADSESVNFVVAHDSPVAMGFGAFG